MVVSIQLFVDICAFNSRNCAAVSDLCYPQTCLVQEEGSLLQVINLGNTFNRIYLYANRAAVLGFTCHRLPHVDQPLNL